MVFRRTVYPAASLMTMVAEVCTAMETHSHILDIYANTVHTDIVIQTSLLTTLCMSSTQCMLHAHAGSWLAKLRYCRQGTWFLLRIHINDTNQQLICYKLLQYCSHSTTWTDHLHPPPPDGVLSAGPWSCSCAVTWDSGHGVKPEAGGDIPGPAGSGTAGR